MRGLSYIDSTSALKREPWKRNKLLHPFALFVSIVEPLRNWSDLNTLSIVETRGGETLPPCARFAPAVIPEERNSRTGVMIRYVHDPNRSWFLFRASYGRENIAFNYLVGDDTYAYVGKCYVRKFINSEGWQGVTGNRGRLFPDNGRADFDGLRTYGVHKKVRNDGYYLILSCINK